MSQNTVKLFLTGLSSTAVSQGQIRTFTTDSSDMQSCRSQDRGETSEWGVIFKDP